jgi:hypothetical protein
MATRWSKLTVEERIEALKARIRKRRARGDGVDRGYQIACGIRRSVAARIARMAAKFGHEPDV